MDLINIIFQPIFLTKCYLGKIDEDITCFILVRKFLLADELLLELCILLFTHQTNSAKKIISPRPYCSESLVLLIRLGNDGRRPLDRVI